MCIHCNFCNASIINLVFDFKFSDSNDSHCEPIFTGIQLLRNLYPYHKYWYLPPQSSFTRWWVKLDTSFTFLNIQLHMNKNLSTRNCVKISILNLIMQVHYCKGESIMYFKRMRTRNIYFRIIIQITKE